MPSAPRSIRDRKSTRLNSSHTVIYTLSLHDALPISPRGAAFTAASVLSLREPRNLLVLRLCVHERPNFIALDARALEPVQVARSFRPFRHAASIACRQRLVRSEIGRAHV